MRSRAAPHGARRDRRRSRRTSPPTPRGRSSEFVEELSNWYVRRNRRRFWKAGGRRRHAGGLHTLYECLTHGRAAARAVHAVRRRGDVPQPRRGQACRARRTRCTSTTGRRSTRRAIDEQLSRRRGAGAAHGLARPRRARSRRACACASRWRRPCSCRAPRPSAPRSSGSRDQVADELNVKRVEVGTTPASALRYTLRPNLPVLGPRLGSDVGKVRAGARGSADARRGRARACAPVSRSTIAGVELAASDDAARRSRRTRAGRPPRSRAPNRLPRRRNCRGRTKRGCRTLRAPTGHGRTSQETASPAFLSHPARPSRTAASLPSHDSSCPSCPHPVRASGKKTSKGASMSG